MANYTSVPINVGTGPGGTDGDDTRSAFEKVIADLAQIFAAFTFDSTTNELTSDVVTTGGVTLAGKLILGAEGTDTIAAGVIVYSNARMIIDTESAAASDDLDTINGGTDGEFLIIRQANSSRDVTFKDGSGNLSLAGDYTPGNINGLLTLVFSSSNATWYELSRSSN